MEKSNYEKLAAIDVSEHIEKKQNLSYLSWAWAVDQLLRADSAANWAYNEPVRFPDDSVMVSCTVTAFGKPMTMHLPVMDFRNKAVKNPDAFAVNTAMMRCLVKAIALHGLGLYIYAGEDLPLSDDTKDDVKAARHKPTQDSTFNPDADEETFLLSVVDSILASKDDIPTASDLFYKQNLDNDQKVWIWDKLGKESALRSAIKKHHQSKEQ